MTVIEILGLTAAFCTTSSFLPQAIKVVKTRNTESLSLLMYIVFTAGVALWLLYGMLRDDFAIVVANLVTIVLALVILFIKVHNDYIRPRRSQRDH